MGSATLRFIANPEFVNRRTVHGGLWAAMLATGITLLATQPKELTAVMVSLDTGFEKPAKLAYSPSTLAPSKETSTTQQLRLRCSAPVARGRAMLRIGKRQAAP